MEEFRSDRARIHDNARDVYDAIRGADPEQSPFLTNKDIFMLAASIGFNKGIRKPLEVGKKDGIRMEVFSEKDRDILKGIALADTENVHVLDREHDDLISSHVLTIAEEYANGGIDEIRDTLLNKPGRVLWNLVDMLKNIQ